MQLRSSTRRQAPTQVIPAKSYELIGMIEVAKSTQDRGQKLAQFIRIHKFLHENCEYFTNPRFVRCIELILQKTAEFKQEISRMIQESGENLDLAFRCYYFVDMVHQEYKIAYYTKIQKEIK